MTTTTTDKPTCWPRRHLPAHLFETYDAIAACTQNAPHEYYAGPYVLANLTNRSVETERNNIEELVRLGWLVPVNDGVQQRWSRGQFDTKKFRRLGHDEFVAAHEGGCPPPKYVYDKETHDWKLAKAGVLKKGLVRANRKKALEKFADGIEEAITNRKHGTVVAGPVFPEVVALGAGRFEEPAVTSPLVAVDSATATSPLVTVEPAPPQARLEPTVTSPLVKDGYKPAVPAVTSPLVRKHYGKPDEKQHTHTSPAATHTKACRYNQRWYGGAVCVCEENSLETVLPHLPKIMLGSQWKKGEQEKATALIAKHGWETFLAAAILYYYEVPDDRAFSNTVYRWSGLLDNFAGWLPKITDEMLEEQRYKRWVAIPANAAKRSADIDAQVTAQVMAEAKALEEATAQFAKEHPEIEAEQKYKEAVHVLLDRFMRGEEVIVPVELDSDFLGFGIWPRKHIVTGEKVEITIDEATRKLVYVPKAASSMP
jgi:hypothetical protein